MQYHRRIQDRSAYHPTEIIHNFVMTFLTAVYIEILVALDVLAPARFCAKYVDTLQSGLYFTGRRRNSLDFSSSYSEVQKFQMNAAASRNTENIVILAHLYSLLWTI